MTRRAGTSVLDTSFAHALRLFREEKLAEADAVCRSLLRLAPNHPDVVHLRAAIACRSPEPARAAGLARAAAAAEPQRLIYLNTLGVALRMAGSADPAMRWFRRALALDALAAEPRLNLGGVLADRREPAAEREMRRALALDPGSAETLNNLGAMGMRAGLLPPALLRFGRALAVAPLHLEAWRNRSGAASWYGRIGLAQRCARTALALAPTDPESHDMLANALAAQGDARAAQVPLRRALAIRPAFHAAAGNLLFAMAYDGGTTLEALAREQRAWAARVAPRTRSFERDRDPVRRLKLGYLSGDFRTHPVGWNVDGIIRHHDRSHFEVSLYSTTPRPDATTRSFAAMAERFRDLGNQEPAAISDAIRDDGIDVLIALAPHTADNPAAALADKPAPVVIAFHAIASTGLPTVDHWLTDAVLHPADSKEWFSESLLRLPCFYLHAAPGSSPDIGPVPSLASGAVTFGSFNNPPKITPEVIALWARVLHAVPGSRLMLRHGDRFGDAHVAARYRSLFATEGIGPDRLVLDGGLLVRAKHLAMFDRVDVSLDPFPFNGSTTTFESLWMGVPVVSLVGDRFVSRVGLDVLTRVGLADLAAPDAGTYVGAAAALAGDVERRASLRTGLRARLAASELCDAPAHARALEAAVRHAWRQWCASR